MKEMINNTEAFDELLDSHAYRFRHPTELIEKFFINYGTGHNCKTFLLACFDLIYPNCANVAVKQQQLESDTFNAWVVRNLLLWLEEAEKGKLNYRERAIQQAVKQVTTLKASARGMYNETKSARNWAIAGMNTNSKDLYGLARSDPATLQRLVIIDFKENLHGEIYNEKKLKVKCNKFIRDPNFAYSLYYYLAEVRKINENFSPVRYYGKDKQTILDRITMANSITNAAAL